MKGSTLLSAGACLLIASATPVNAASETVQNFQGACTGFTAGCGLNPNDIVECFTSLNLSTPIELKEATYSISASLAAQDSLDLVVYDWTGSGEPGAVIDTLPIAPGESTIGTHIIDLDPAIQLNSENFCIGVHAEGQGGFGIQTATLSPGGLGTSWAMDQFCIGNAGGNFVDVAGIGLGNWCITATIDEVITAIQVDIDIKFCSDPNAFNCKKKGSLPVTIFGTDDLDVTDIDLTTLRLCLDDMETCTSAGLKDWSIADRGDPATDIGANACAINETTLQEEDFLTQDGNDDLDVTFYARDVRDNLLVDFCGLDKGAESPTLILMGTTVDGITVHSLPIDDVAVDRLLKVNK